MSDWSSDCCSSDLGSEHPLADAIVNAAREQGIALATVEGFESGSGIGVRGKVEGKRLALGNTALMEQEGVEVARLREKADSLSAHGASVMRSEEQTSESKSLMRST